MGKRITFEEVQESFSCRADIELCYDDFNGWKKKSKFYDKVANDYFWSIPYDVLRLNIVHPKRRLDKKKQTSLKNWGVEYPTQSKQIKEKTKQTNIKKYGKEYYFQTEDKKTKSRQTSIKKYGVEHHAQVTKIKEKARQTNIKKYGVENPQQNKKIKEKAKKTLKEKYGVENPSQFIEFQEKKRETSLKNWGVAEPLQSKIVRDKGKEAIKKKYSVEHQMHSDIIKEKIRQTCLQRYRVTHFAKTNSFLKQIGKKKIAETNQYVVDWLNEQENPKPGIVTVNQVFSGKKEIPLKDLEKYIDEFRNYKSSLEILSEQLFETKHYNKKPKQIKKLYRPDFKLSPRIFLNVDGLYWHSELQKDKWYHFEIQKEFEGVNLRIFQFREDEIRDKPEIVKSIVDNAIGKTKNKIYARKCDIKEIIQKEATKFLKDNHLMGSTNAKHVGLFYNGKLVSILSYKQRKNVCKIERFCSFNNHVVIGGFSKLLKYLEQNCLSPNVTEIHNWVDLRYGTGNQLITKGFKQINDTLGWKWTDGENAFNRLKCRANMDKRKLSQQQHADELEWVKIYDAGQRLFIKPI